MSLFASYLNVPDSMFVPPQLSRNLLVTEVPGGNIGGEKKRTETTLSLPQSGQIVLLKVRDGERHACSNHSGNH